MGIQQHKNQLIAQYFLLVKSYGIVDSHFASMNLDLRTNVRDFVYAGDTSELCNVSCDISLRSSSNKPAAQERFDNPTRKAEIRKNSLEWKLIDLNGF